MAIRRLIIGHLPINEYTRCRPNLGMLVGRCVGGAARLLSIFTFFTQSLLGQFPVRTYLLFIFTRLVIIKMSKNTRSAIECPIFGAPKDLVCSALPTLCDVIQYFLWIRHNLEKGRVNRNLLVSETSEIVAQKVKEIWISASVPTVSHQRIVQLIKEYQKKRKDLLKPYLQRKDVPSYKSKIEAFVRDSQRLFDFAACKCVEFERCSCLKPNKVRV